MNPDYKRFSELLPFYINRTLDASDHAFVQHYLDSHPEARTELSFTRSLGEAVKAAATKRNPQVGLDRLLKDWRKSIPQKPGLQDQIKGWFEGWGLSPAMALASLVIVVQAILLIRTQLPDQSENERYRSGMSLEAQPQYDLKLTIKPTTGFSALSELLRSQRCHIVAGPTDAGEVWVRVDLPSQPEKVRKVLLDSGLIDDALLNPGNAK